ncbi:MAG: outer membrane lipid asymmetry maintenance protein MlaD [Methylococcaceae bacterium]|jgi:phospholipid/cholesterol/gamma-HCH transport system substrate-binding protein|nr:outer membrane lipid asymmetry maintenance protein MlaD [Methylococcaceae bacterium]MDD1630931.1 outer membrane lipid asymmetry maintenance protein MlaD [Methylococcaceae bacterium]MDD1636860.1 outer membrane lipid asymmetry maintenance protein MlaD [Methylococcaceae bacterium]MDD1642243.1 outer membrane lipid asymmetry maintenance protein MlaD [Methylococcaceae bacterium]
MQHTSTQDTLVGLFVASGIVGLFFLAMQVSNLSSFVEEDSYTITARFENSGGLKIKSPVSAAGVKIGRVSNISFDPKTYESVVQMNINSHYNTIPDDTTASIFTAGLLGEQYVNLEPGGSDVYLQNEGEIEITQSAIILEKAIGQFLFKSAEESAEEKK